MSSLRFSACPEIYESRQRRASLLRNSELRAGDLFGVSSWMLHLAVKSVGSRKVDVIQCGAFGSNHGEAKSSELFFSGKQVAPSVVEIIKLDANRNVRLKNVVVHGLEGSRRRRSVYGSGKNARSSQFTDVTSSDVGLSEKVLSSDDANAKNNLDIKYGRKIWKRFIGIKKAVAQSKIDHSVSTRSQRTKKYTNSDRRIEAALSGIGPDSTIEQCNSVLKLLETNTEDKAIEFFEWMKANGKLKGNTNAYQLALRALARKQEWYSAKRLLEEIYSDSDCELNVQLFNSLIYVCAKRGIVGWGANWFRMMLKKQVQPNIATFGMLMALYQNSGNVSEAEFTFTMMRNLKLKCPPAYSAMVTIYVRLGFYHRAEEVIGMMDKDEVLPNLENWLVRLNAYSQQGKMVEAERVLKSMVEAGISPNIVAYNTLITGYGKIARTRDSEQLFNGLKIVGLEPDETTYRSMIEGFGRTNDYEKVKWYYKKLKVSGFQPSSSNFYTIINLQSRHGDENGVAQTLGDMLIAGCQLSSVLSSLLQAYERVGRVEKVPSILKASFYDKILLDPTSCSILLMSYVQNLLLDDALQVLRDKKWEDSDFEDNLYHLLICSCKEAGHYENAIKIYTQMPKSETRPNLHIMCSMMDIYGALNKFSDAENIYLTLKGSNVNFDMVAYSIVVRMYIKAGNLENACEVLETMEKQKNIIPDTFLFRDMLRTYQQRGLKDKLANAYYWLLKCGVTWDEAMYNCVINCCGQALPVDELSRLFDEMVQCGYAANTITFNVMLDVYGKAGLFKKARKVFQMARKQGLADVISYNTIIAAYGKIKDFRNMQSVVQKMKNAGYPVSLEAYNCMLDAYGKENQLEEFNDVLQKMKKSNCVSDHYTYNIMINIYGRKGWIEEVACVLAELKERGMEPDLYSYNTLIKAYGIAGMVEEAVSVVQEMRRKGINPDRITYTNLITALQRNENFLEAVKWSLWMKQMESQVQLCPS